MAKGINSKCCEYMMLLVALLLQINLIFAARNHDEVPRKKHSMPPKGTVKTLEMEAGDIVDCVDFYKQPAFDHHLLENYMIQMNPTSRPSGWRPVNKSDNKLAQLWSNQEECPNGTVAIVRRGTTNSNFSRSSTSANVHNVLTETHEHVTLVERHQDTDIHGIHGVLNVWKPQVQADEFSLSQVWLCFNSPRSPQEFNSIEVGWIVNPQHYNQMHPVLFSYWTNGNYQTGRGCYDVDCPGFVITTRKAILGKRISTVSTYNGDQFAIDVQIYQDRQTKDWWLEVNEERVGYWPFFLFIGLANGANAVEWGGEIIDQHHFIHHTTTQMGSGSFAELGYKKASYISHLQYVNANHRAVDPTRLSSILTRPDCYHLHRNSDSPTRESWGTHFFFGGPGFSSTCR